MRPLLLPLVALLVLGVVACDSEPTSLETAQEASFSHAMVNSNAPFQTWYQGFNHGTTGWYGAETPGPLGWCGEIEAADRRNGEPGPSAGRGYATVAQGPCNEFWDGMFSQPGAQLVNGPWAPGPDLALFSEVWPVGGFVMELDVYLDPSWTEGALEPGTVNFFAVPGTVITYVAALRELASPITDPVFHYFAVPVFPGAEGLSIFGHTVSEAGWYTFRHVFSDADGALGVVFELADRRGRTLLEESIDTEYFTGTPTSDFTPAELGTGYVWFVGIAPGLELPIDEHRLRRGR